MAAAVVGALGCDCYMHPVLAQDYQQIDPDCHNLTHFITFTGTFRAIFTQTQATVLLFCNIYHKLCAAAEYFGDMLSLNVVYPTGDIGLCCLCAWCCLIPS